VTYDIAEIMRRFTASLAILILGVGLGRSLHAQNRPSEDLPKLDRVVRITCLDGILRLDWANDQFAAAAPITVQGPEARWKVTVLRTGAGPAGIGLDRVAGDAAAPSHYWNVAISHSGGQIRISATRGGKTPRDNRLILSQREDGSLRGMATSNLAAGRNDYSAINLLDLRLRQPQVINDYLKPLLEQLGQPDVLTPGATDVYRVFDDVSPDEQTMAKVQAIVPRLSAVNSLEREAAMEDFRRLGPRAILVLLKLDRSDLMPETQMRIARLLAEQTRRKFDDPKTMREDVAFLADCLDFNDERVRKASTLRIEKLTGWSIPPADWSHPGDYIRTKLAQQLKENR
jgi:hypothetical protein